MIIYFIIMISKNQIYEIVNKIVNKYHPLRVILFGSYGDGVPHENSDVDFLVILQSVENRIQKASEIHNDVYCGFPFDVIVHSEHSLSERLNKEDFFLQEITQNGTLLYEAAHA